VIWHQAATPDLDLLLAAPFGHQFQVGSVVPLVEERLLPPVAALRDVVWQARYNYSC